MLRRVAINVASRTPRASSHHAWPVDVGSPDSRVLAKAGSVRARTAVR